MEPKEEAHSGQESPHQQVYRTLLTSVKEWHTLKASAWLLACPPVPTMHRTEGGFGTSACIGRGWAYTGRAVKLLERLLQTMWLEVRNRNEEKVPHPSRPALIAQADAAAVLRSVITVPSTSWKERSQWEGLVNTTWSESDWFTTASSHDTLWGRSGLITTSDEVRLAFLLTPCRMPVAGLNTSTIPLWEGMFFSALPGYRVTSFVPRLSDNRENAGITSRHLWRGIILHQCPLQDTSFH